MKKTITLLVALFAVAGVASAAEEAPPTQLLPFYPQAGIIGQDLYLTNYLDLDPGPGVRAGPAAATATTVTPARTR